MTVIQSDFRSGLRRPNGGEIGGRVHGGGVAFSWVAPRLCILNRFARELAPSQLGKSNDVIQYSQTKEDSAVAHQDRETVSDGKCENPKQKNLQQETEGGSSAPTQQAQKGHGRPSSLL